MWQSKGCISEPLDYTQLLLKYCILAAVKALIKLLKQSLNCRFFVIKPQFRFVYMATLALLCEPGQAQIAKPGQAQALTVTQCCSIRSISTRIPGGDRFKLTNIYSVDQQEPSRPDKHNLRKRQIPTDQHLLSIEPTELWKLGNLGNPGKLGTSGTLNN